jgi:hypothetical protein
MKEIAVAVFVVVWMLSTLTGCAKGPESDAQASGASAKPDTSAGPAYQTVDGKLNKIDGDVYVVQDHTGRELRLHVSNDTIKLRGEKKPGDPIRAEVTKGWHANSIQ